MDKDSFIRAFEEGRILENQVKGLEIQKDQFFMMFAEFNAYVDCVKDSGLNEIVQIGAYGRYFISLNTQNWEVKE